MLNKRIASILVSGMVMVSMVGCQSTRGHVEYIDNRQNPIESQYEGEDSKTEEKATKELTVKERREVEKAKEAGKQVKKSNKASDENTRKPRYWLGQYIGDYTDSEVEAMNKIIYNEIDKAIEKEFQNNNNTNSDIDDRAEYEKEYQPKDHTGEDEDYWKTDGDLPEEQTTEPEGAYTEPADNNNISVEEQQGSDQGANIPDEQPQQDYNSEE